MDPELTALEILIDEMEEELKAMKAALKQIEARINALIERME
jgi:hypothetical protein